MNSLALAVKALRGSLVRQSGGLLLHSARTLLAVAALEGLAAAGSLIAFAHVDRLRKVTRRL
jgi:hypothetical protein